MQDSSITDYQCRPKSYDIDRCHIQWPSRLQRPPIPHFKVTPRLFDFVVSFHLYIAFWAL